jgi:polyphosphate kinase
LERCSKTCSQETEKIFFKKIEELSKDEFLWLRSISEEKYFPVLTPLAVDPTHPFPLILNKSLNIIVSLKNRSEEKS